MPLPLTERNMRKIVIALAIYITSLIASNTLGVKLVPFFFGLHLSAAVLSFPIVFLMTDVIGEVYGKRMARLFVLAGFITTALYLAYTILSLALPWSPDGAWAHDAYGTIFGTSIRMAIASLVAYGIGEYQDVFSFFLFKRFWGEKFFWLRSTLSNIWSQFLDSAIFMLIAFYGIYETHTLVGIIISWWIFKVAMGIAYLPLSYLGLWILKDKTHA